MQIVQLNDTIVLVHLKLLIYLRRIIQPKIYFIDGQSLSASDFGAYDERWCVATQEIYWQSDTPGTNLYRQDVVIGVNDTEPVMLMTQPMAFDGSLDQQCLYR